MKAKTTTRAPAQSTTEPSRADLSLLAAGLAEDLADASHVLNELGALFAAIRLGGPHVPELADLGRRVAVDAADLADLIQEDAQEKARVSSAG